LKIGSIVIDCNEFDKMLAFWQESLHYVAVRNAQFLPEAAEITQENVSWEVWDREWV